jgi:hypothetical protein
MADCPNLITCPFFIGKMENMPAVSSYLKSQFCQRDYQTCARYMVFQVLGKQAVPADLFPNEPKRAYALISKANSSGVNK